MKIEKIIEMINNNEIEKLKQQLTEELYTQRAPNKNIYTSIVKLSKLAEKAQRKKIDGIIEYITPKIAGMFLDKYNRQVICVGGYGVIFNEKYNGLTLAPNWDDKENNLNIEQAFPDENNYTHIEIDINKITNDLKLDKNHLTQIYNNSYPTKQILDIYNCLEECEFFCDQSNQLKPLILKGKNGKGIICPIHNQQKK